MRYVLGIIIGIIFIINVNAEVQHVYMGKWDTLRSEVITSILLAVLGMKGEID